MAYIGIVSATDSEQLSPNYIGFQPTVQRPESAFVVDTFTGNGVQTVFPLSNPKPITARALLVSVAGELLVPITDYDLDNTGNIDFTTAPLVGEHITVHHLIFPKNEATTSIRKLDDISSSFDGVTTQFTLTANGVAANILGQNVLIISIDGVVQEPGIAYTTSGDQIIFSEAPSSISSFYAIDVGTTGIGTPSDATIDPDKFLTDNNPTTGKVLGINSSGGLSWVTVTGGVGATNLDGLSDVAISSPLAGQVLKYNGTNFVNAKLDYSELNGPPTLATVATTGNYNDLSNKPNIPTDLNGFTDSTNLLFDKQYGSLLGLPSIPQSVADLLDTDIVSLSNNDILVWNGVYWINDQLSLVDLGIADGTNGQVLTTDGAGNFSFTTVAGAGGGFSGDYNDLTNTPAIPTTTSELTNDSGFITLADIPAGFSGDYNDLTNTPDLTVYAALAGATFTGVVKIDDAVHEAFQTKSNATGIVAHDCSTGQIFYHTTPSANWTVNLTNLNLASGYATNVTLVVVQGATGYYPSAVQISGAAQTINWQGNATPTPSTSRTDVISFSILNNSGTYVVLGQLTGF
jgi:hypothetical protein